ncbi:MAG TPA: IS1 family transposase [Flavobacteriales bacterium]|nr:IS1 family transposase [Flavobacteriales bacterium]
MKVDRLYKGNPIVALAFYHIDGCETYPARIPTTLRRVKRTGRNWIGRMNLTLRTRIKRLGRRTIRYTKSTTILAACVALACWGRPTS